MDFKIDFMRSYDEASLIAELQRIARERGTKRLTCDIIDKYGRVNSATVAKKFGLLRYALVAAGLEPTTFNRATDEELIGELAKLWTKTMRDSGRSPLARDAERYGMPVSPQTITARFGSWKKGLEATAFAMGGIGEAPVPVVRPKRKRTKLSVARRFDVLKRDGYTCRICRKAGGQLEVDHIVPVTKGGKDTIDNLQAVCWACNRGKGTKLM